jgi:Ca2+-binding RTX toxin-like protein
VAAVLGFAPQASAARSGFFSPTGPMTVSRTGAVAAPLPDGRVLVAGGSVNPFINTLPTAEVFNPATNSFSAAGIGSMSVARYGAVAVPLSDGRVLVAGGFNHQDSYLSSAEVFDPATNSFSSAGIGSMSTPRDEAMAAPLPDGRVLVAGGFNGGGSLSSAEVFNPSTNSFSSTGIGSMFTTRYGAVAALLPDGRVLVAGGFVHDFAFPSEGAQVFDPTTNTFDESGIGSTLTPRSGAAAAPLPDGALVAGGFNGAGAVSSAEVYDPALDIFIRAGIGSMSVSRDGAVAAPLPGGRVLVAGGSDSSGGGVLTSAEIFAPLTCEGKQPTIVGNPGADRGFTGTPGADVIAGLDGDDWLIGLAGNDVICGGNGQDTVSGQKGNDTLDGDEGNDTLVGGPGKDILRGGPGKDILKGGPDKDVLKGGPGKDVLKGGPGKDVLKGGPGKDKQVQ